jgi:iron complex transport system substrate-binding protein
VFRSTIPPAQPTSCPLTVTDNGGTSVTSTAVPRRIVSLNPGATETVFALGAGDRLAAADTCSIYPPQAQAISTRLNTYPTPSLETIVALQPDLVQSLAESDDMVAPRMHDRRDSVAQAVVGAPRPGVFYELDATDPTQPFTVGLNGFYGQLVNLAGGSNVFADLPGGFSEASAESVIARDPEVIALTGPGAQPGFPAAASVILAPHREPRWPVAGKSASTPNLPLGSGVRLQRHSRTSCNAEAIHPE